MRALILIAGVLVLAGCGNNDQSDNTSNVDENLTAENIVSNDVTAIDAVTGDAANMAAESDVNDIGAANLSNADNSSAPARPVAKHSRPAATPTENGPANLVSNATSNSAD